MARTKKVDWDIVLDLAERLGVEYKARHQWKSRGHVPYRWRQPMIELAARDGRPITYDMIPDRGAAA